MQLTRSLGRGAGALVATLVIGCFAGTVPAQILVLDDPLQGSTFGTQSGGVFGGGGWQVTGQYDSIYWHIPTTSHGAAEWDIRGLFPNESRPAMDDKTELFHMYDYTFDNADVNYFGYRNNPYKHFVRKIGALDGPPKTDALELLWQIIPNYEEPDTAALSWDPSHTYHFREEWGPDGSGNSVLRTYRDSILLRTATVPGAWNPTGHSVRIGAANPPGTRSAPIDAILSNILVWNLANIQLAGDVNSDLYVDFGDLGLLAPFYGEGPGMTWLNGDFNGDGFVNMTDLNLMAVNFGTTPTGGPLGLTGLELLALLPSVPEPGTAALCALGLLSFLGRRRRCV